MIILEWKYDKICNWICHGMFYSNNNDNHCSNNDNDNDQDNDNDNRSNRNDNNDITNVYENR